MDKQEKKPKKQLTEEQLERLAAARVKANAVRKEKAGARRKEKELLDLKAKQRQDEVDKEIASLQQPATAKPAVKPKRKTKVKMAAMHITHISLPQWLR